MKRKIIVSIVMVSLLLLTVFSLSSCEKADIYDLINVKWYSSDFEMEIIVIEEYEAFGSIDYEGHKVEFYINFGLKVKFVMMIKPDENTPLGSAVGYYYDAYGSYEYSEEQKKLVLKFSSSDAFDNAFSTIALTATEIDPLKINPKERYDVGWISETPNMRFGIRLGDTKGGGGIVQIGDTTHMIFFEWNADQKFSVYLLDENGDKHNTSVMDGSYSGSAVSLIIHIMKDKLFSSNYQSITFKPDKDMTWYEKVFPT
jgi:hypothetical protein